VVKTKLKRRDVMEKLIEKLEKIIEKHIDDFENSPLTTSLKIIVYYWIFKQLYSIVKGGK